MATKAEKAALGADEAAQSATLIAANFIKCDNIEYQPGDSFPLDHPEAERLFGVGAVKEG